MYFVFLSKRAAAANTDGSEIPLGNQEFETRGSSSDIILYFSLDSGYNWTKLSLK